MYVCVWRRKGGHAAQHMQATLLFVAAQEQHSLLKPSAQGPAPTPSAPRARLKRHRQIVGAELAVFQTTTTSCAKPAAQRTQLSAQGSTFSAQDQDSELRVQGSAPQAQGAWARAQRRE